jgi:ADP-ribosylglycohydrolase
MQHALLCLDGLSVGDAFGERFLERGDLAQRWLAQRQLPPGPWPYTDDTVMAISIVHCLHQYGRIEPNILAAMFAVRYRQEPGRGYGGTAQGILWQIGAGVPWRQATQRPFYGRGSMGNGAAMRVAPLGAYFADDPRQLAEQARLSAEVTHAHPEGQAGAVAVAAAAAWMARRHGRPEGTDSRDLMAFALDCTPAGETNEGLRAALDLPLERPVQEAASTLGNGSRVLAADTVPFTLWCAARHWRDYPEALWNTVRGGGDCDTTCAIVGGLVALSVGRGGLPAQWLARREGLKLGFTPSLEPPAAVPPKI